jgi:CheY-like chemotaxis protein
LTNISEVIGDNTRRNIEAQTQPDPDTAPIPSKFSLSAVLYPELEEQSAFERETSERVMTILLIDDTMSLLDIHAQELRSRGYEVSTGLGPSEGMNLLKQKRYGLVMVDIKMPNQNGDELVAAFRHWERFNRILPQWGDDATTDNSSNFSGETSSGTSKGEQRNTMQTIYAFSAYTNEGVRRRCQAAGMMGIISKPMQINVIDDLMKEHRSQWVSTCDTFSHRQDSSPLASTGETRTTSPTTAQLETGVDFIDEESGCESISLRAPHVTADVRVHVDAQEGPRSSEEGPPPLWIPRDEHSVEPGIVRF